MSAEYEQAKASADDYLRRLKAERVDPYLLNLIEQYGIARFEMGVHAVEHQHANKKAPFQNSADEGKGL